MHNHSRLERMECISVVNEILERMECISVINKILESISIVDKILEMFKDSGEV